MAKTRIIWLDLVSSFLGLLAGIVIVAAGLFGPLEVGDTDVAVLALGIFGAGFGAVGIGHLSLDANHRGMGELLAGVGAIFLALSFVVPLSAVLFALGVLGLGSGGIILLAESFDLFEA